MWYHEMMDESEVLVFSARELRVYAFGRPTDAAEVKHRLHARRRNERGRGRGSGSAGLRAVSTSRPAFLPFGVHLPILLLGRPGSAYTLLRTSFFYTTGVRRWSTLESAAAIVAH